MECKIETEVEIEGDRTGGPEGLDLGLDLYRLCRGCPVDEFACERMVP